jgi:hypothetical protein
MKMMPRSKVSILPGECPSTRAKKNNISHFLASRGCTHGYRVPCRRATVKSCKMMDQPIRQFKSHSYDDVCTVSNGCAHLRAFHASTFFPCTAAHWRCSSYSRIAIWQRGGRRDRDALSFMDTLGALFSPVKTNAEVAQNIPAEIETK